MHELSATQNIFNLALQYGGDAAHIIAIYIDREWVEAAGALAVQINTGGNYHLDAVMLREALDQLPLSSFDLRLLRRSPQPLTPSPTPNECWAIDFRQHVLDAAWCDTHHEAQCLADQWRHIYDEQRPHDAPLYF
jgi:hypothetical protein